MELIFSLHAVQRMQERKISVNEIALIIREPDGIIKQSKDKMIYYKNIKHRKDNMVAAVTVQKTRTYMEIVTVMINFEVKNENNP